MNCPKCSEPTRKEDSYLRDGARVRDRRCIRCNGLFQTRQRFDLVDESFEKWIFEPSAEQIAAWLEANRKSPEGAQWLSEGLFYKFGLRGKLFVYRAAAGWVRASFDDLPDEAEAVTHA